MVPSQRPSLQECHERGTSLPPEVEEGNVEYKVRAGRPIRLTGL